MNLNEFSDDDLIKEIEKRKLKNERPVLISSPDLTKVIKSCEEMISTIQSGKYHEDSDYDHYIYENIMEALYGNNVFDWINKRI